MGARQVVLAGNGAELADRAAGVLERRRLLLREAQAADRVYEDAASDPFTRPIGDGGDEPTCRVALRPDEGHDVDAFLRLADLRDRRLEYLAVVDPADFVASLQPHADRLVERVREVGPGLGRLGREVHLADRLAPDAETGGEREGER